MNVENAVSFKDSVSQLRQRVDRHLEQYLAQAATAPQLYDAMHYSTFNGGKRLRPVLVYASCEALGGDLAAADPAAAAVECIHAYSLIHDDLPAMDDDDLRRGKPTCHIAFDEPTAILAGDALQALAFEILASPSSVVAAEQQLQMLQSLAFAAGDKGMVAGQSIDICAVQAETDLQGLERMHGLKTGALIRASVRMGALAANADAATLEKLDLYASAIGLAFQVQDDILDIESDTETLGKPQGSDLEADKATYPALLGLEMAKQKAEELHQQALAALDGMHQAKLLRQLADYVVQRNH
ncbi:MAG: (2E,6E)-farnesyl diphosphate synthase [Motiliproteus sp.]|nr:(2E,6E)-farnesyl diphosphate synthase [Motiliproteus sp.]MCW9052650.1 (2E,6E)-farnesyl diphosphate synthase [Motiliproteus sp.]